jgi:hypothetical protein
LGGCGEGELVLDAAWAAQSEPAQTEDAFEMCEEHLDFLSPVLCGLIEL